MLSFKNAANSRLALLIAFYVAYLFFGATVFDAVEKPHEIEMTQQLNSFIQQFKNKHNSCISEADLSSFIQLISSANDKGVRATNNVTREPNWSFGQSVFYASTVLTTIGYGNVSPLTKLGKLFLIVFSVIGLPATLLLLYAIIERLMKFTGSMLGYFTEKTLQITSRMGEFGQTFKRSDLRVFFAVSLALTVLVFLFIIPAVVYSHIEGWSYLDSFYYCFISLSTVGLGK
jgi:potassium channel subfamily K protein 1